MSEEAAFLEALKANPADDTARLVYADWLDEHNKPQKAEYLRLIVELARSAAPEERPESHRVPALVKRIKVIWRKNVGERFAVTLFGYEPTRGNKVIELISKFCWMNWSDAQHASENLPFCLRVQVTFEVARNLAERIRQTGAIVCVIPSDARSLPYTVKYDVVVSRLSAENDQDQRESQEALALFLVSALGAEPADAAVRAAAEEISLERGLTSEEAWRRVRQLESHAPVYYVFGTWTVYVHARHVVTKSAPS